MPQSILSNLIIENIYSTYTGFSAEGTSSKRTNRDRWALVIKYEGETVYHFDGRKIISNRSNIVVLPKGISYEWESVKEGHFISLEFESETKHNGIISLETENTDEALATLKKLEQKRTSREISLIEALRDTYTALLQLTKSQSHEYIPRDKKKKLTPALDFIHAHYTEDISNDIIASKTELSTVYFRKLFVEIYRTSPMKYVKSLKIKKAKEMLRGDFGSITDIATALGYPSIYDFSRDFKKQVGVSPSDFSENQYV